jgi:hypothetical protein
VAIYPTCTQTTTLALFFLNFNNKSSCVSLQMFWCKSFFFAGTMEILKIWRDPRCVGI